MSKPVERLKKTGRVILAVLLLMLMLCSSFFPVFAVRVKAAEAIELKVTVTNKKNAALTGVTVSVLGAGNGTNATKETDADGSAIFLVEEDERYSVTVTADVYKTLTDTVDIAVGQGSTSKTIVMEEKQAQTLVFAEDALSLEYGEAGGQIVDETEALSSAKVNYSSQNSAVATVDEAGEITALELGTTIIYAEKGGDENYLPADTASYELTILPATSGGITFADPSITKYAGDGDFYLVAELADKALAKGAISYTSSNTKIATVTSDGLVKIVAKNSDIAANGGPVTVKISASFISEDGSCYTSGTAICQLTVAETGARADIGYGKAIKTEDFAYGATGKQTLDKPQGLNESDIHYISSDPTVATVAADGTYTMISAGQTTITATVKSNDAYNGQTASYTLMIQGNSNVTVSFTESTVHATYLEDYSSLENPLYLNTTNDTQLISAEVMAGSTLQYSVVEGDSVSVDEESGALTVLKAGASTVQVKFTGSPSYGNAVSVAKYTVYIYKKEMVLEIGDVDYLRGSSLDELNENIKTSVEMALAELIAGNPSLSADEIAAFNALSIKPSHKVSVYGAVGSYAVNYIIGSMDSFTVTVLNNSSRVIVKSYVPSSDDYTINPPAGEAVGGWVQEVIITGANGCLVGKQDINQTYFSPSIHFGQPMMPESAEFYVMEGKKHAISTKIPIPYGVDNTAPQISQFTFAGKNGSVLSKALNFLTFGTFFNEEMEITVSAIDDLAKDSENHIASCGLASITLNVNGAAYQSSQVVYDGNGYTGHATFVLPIQDFETISAISATAQDKLGNTSAEVLPDTGNTNGWLQNSNLMLEHNKPVIQISQADAVYSANGKSWYNGDVSIGLSMADADSGLRRVRVTINGKVIMQDENGIILRDDYYKDSSATLTPQLFSVNTSQGEVPADGSYLIEVEAVDNAGNLTTKSVTLYKDIVAPSVVNFAFKAAEGYADFSGAPVETTDFGYFFQVDTQVSLTAEDADPSSGIKAFLYYLQEAETGKTTAPQLLPAVDGKASFIIPKGTRCQVYALAIDNVENQQGNYVTPGASVLETPEQHMADTHIQAVWPQTDNNDTDALPLYAGDVPVEITVLDEYSGLRQVEWTVTAESDTAQNQAFSTGNISVAPEEAEASLREAGWAIEKAERNLITAIKRTVTVSHNANNIQLWVKMVDRAGNTSEYTKNISIDKTQPLVTVAYDNNSVLNGKYFKASRTATVQVVERNFNPDASVINTNGTVSGWQKTYEGTAEQSYNDRVWLANVTCNQDNDYTFAISVSDLAGNAATGVNYGASQAPNQFTVDTTTPTIAVSYDNNSVHNEKYYNASRTATITITEHNFASEDVKITTTSSLAGAAVAAPVATGWSASGDTHTATITYAADGDYTFDIEFVDMAGNTAADYAMDTFTVDTTAPTVAIAGVELEKAYNDTVAPVVSFEDVNFDAAGTSISLVGANSGKHDYAQGTSLQQNGTVVTYQDFEHAAEVDDIYTITAKITDLAGNTSEEHVVFSVNRFGSVYELVDGTAARIEPYYLKQPPLLVVREINVNAISNQDVLVAKDGAVGSLKEDAYTIQNEIGAGGWNVCTYSIHEGNFEQEGQYGITFLSEDLAANTSSNRIENNKRQESPIEFVVDRTAPAVLVTGIEEEGRYTETTRPILLNVEDNTALDHFTLEIIRKNGDTTKNTYTLQDLREGNVMEYILTSWEDWQTVTIEAVDKAGNVAEVKSFNILLSANWFIQFINNTLAVVAVTVLLLGTAFIVLLLLVKRRKRQAEM